MTYLEVFCFNMFFNKVKSRAICFDRLQIVRFLVINKDPTLSHK